MAKDLKFSQRKMEQDVLSTSWKRESFGKRKFLVALGLFGAKSSIFSAADAVVVMQDGHSLSSTYLDETNFRSPILVEDMAGLGMKLPPADFTVEDVEKRVGKRFFWIF